LVVGNRFGRLRLCWNRRWRSIPQRADHNPWADANSNGDTHTYSNTNSYADAYRYAQSDAETAPNSAPSSDAAVKG
jgi:hypothetical protein